MRDQAFELIKILLDKGLLALVVLTVGFFLKKWQEDRTFLQNKQHEERAYLLKQQEENRVAELHRQFVPRTEFDLLCDFFGPEAGEYLAHIVIKVNNKSATRRKFKSMKLRLRGIEEGTALEYWDARRPGRLCFPMMLMKDDFVPDGGVDGHYYYVEPQISQVFTYVTKIPANIRYVSAHAKFVPITEKQEQREENEFTEERLFLVRPASKQV